MKKANMSFCRLKDLEIFRWLLKQSLLGVGGQEVFVSLAFYKIYVGFVVHCEK